MSEIAEYVYCNSCGYEDFDMQVFYSRQTANGDWFLCPVCGQETNDVELLSVLTNNKE